MEAFPHDWFAHLQHHDAGFRWCDDDRLPQTQDAPLGNLTNIVSVGTSEQFSSALDVARIGRRRICAQDGGERHSQSVAVSGCRDKSIRRRPGEGWLNIGREHDTVTLLTVHLSSSTQMTSHHDVPEHTAA